MFEEDINLKNCQLCEALLKKERKFVIFTKKIEGSKNLRINHQNLVKVLGSCIVDEDTFIVI